MDKTVVLLFSGQGSQYYQMGQNLYNDYPVFRHWMDQLDVVFHGMTGESLIQHLYQAGAKKSDPFERLLYTHPAIYAVEYALTQILLERNLTPDYVLGTSLGEFSAAAVAGVFSAEEGMEAVVQQAMTIESLCQEGSMLAILGDPKRYEEDPCLNQNAELAAINFDSHYVVAGKKEGIRKIQSYLKAKDISFQMLPVLYGFHSSWIEDAKEAYICYLSKKTFKHPEIRFLSSHLGGNIECLRLSHFWDAVRQPILFQKTIHSLPEHEEKIFVDVSPSGSLATMLKYQSRETSSSSIFSLMTPFVDESKQLQTLTNYLTVQNQLRIAF